MFRAAPHPSGEAHHLSTSSARIMYNVVVSCLCFCSAVSIVGVVFGIRICRGQIASDAVWGRVGVIHVVPSTCWHALIQWWCAGGIQFVGSQDVLGHFLQEACHEGSGIAGWSCTTESCCTSNVDVRALYNLNCSPFVRLFHGISSLAGWSQPLLKGPTILVHFRVFLSTLLNISMVFVNVSMHLVERSHKIGNDIHGGVFDICNVL